MKRNKFKTKFTLLEGQNGTCSWLLETTFGHIGTSLGLERNIFTYLNNISVTRNKTKFECCFVFISAFLSIDLGNILVLTQLTQWVYVPIELNRCHLNYGCLEFDFNFFLLQNKERLIKYFSIISDTSSEDHLFSLYF